MNWETKCKWCRKKLEADTYKELEEAMTLHRLTCFQPQPKRTVTQDAVTDAIEIVGHAGPKS